MNTRLFGAMLPLLALCALCVAQEAKPDDQRYKLLATTKRGISIDDIRHYRKMFRVNQEPVDMVEATKLMCAPPSLAYGPHYDPGVVYYINEIARHGLKAYSGTKLFPVGSIIVKEKQERKTEDSVQIITVMRKIRPERREDSWEYKMYDTKIWSQIDISKQTTDPRKRATCIDCHRRYEKNDYVSDKGIELLLGK